MASLGGSDMSVRDYPDEELLRRAVANCRDRTAPSGFQHPRWVAVADTFALGSTYAMELCKRFDLDPDELVTRHDAD